MGTARIARAEFIKIFKKPSVYIMGIILAIVILLSSFFFVPTKRTDTKVTLSGSTVSEVLLNFETDSGSENQIQYDLKNTQADNMVNFYSYLNTKQSLVEETYAALTTAFTTLNAARNKVNYDAFKVAFVNFKTAIEYGSAGEMTLEGYNGLFDAYFNVSENPISSLLFHTQEEMLSLIQGMYNSANCSDTSAGIDYFCTTWATNNYGKLIDATYTSSVNFITYSCECIVLYTTAAFQTYATQVEVNASTLPAFPTVIDGQTIADQTAYFNYYRSKVSSAMTSLKTYLHKIITTSQPLVLVSNSAYTSLLNTMDSIIKVLNLPDSYSDLSKSELITMARSVGFTEAEISNIKNTPLSINQTKVTIIKKLTNYPNQTSSFPDAGIKTSWEIFTNQSSILLDLYGTLFSSATFVKLTDEQIDELSEIVDETTVRSQAKLNQLEGLDGVNGSISVANTYVSQYKHYNLISYNIISNSIRLIATEGLSNNQVANLYGYDFSTFSRYSVNETLLKNQYLFDTETFAFDYSDVFSFNQNSASQETTIFDFMFFALRISALFIIVFAIIMAASLIASEFDSGTIKLLAIRPFRRGKIIMGKFLATMFFVICFVLFSTVVSLVAGLAMFDWNFQSVLAIFNSSIAFSISPVLLMLINVFCVIIEVVFFTMIAIAMSTITRSFAGTISTTLVLYLLSLGLNMLFSNNLWYAYSPFMNTDFFRFMGGAFASNSSTTISALFITPLLKNMNFYISLGMYSGICAVLLFTTYLVFKKRDI